MKKIVFFITKLGHGGAERVAANLANTCSKCGKYDVNVVLTYSDMNAYKLEDNIKVVSLPFSKNHFIRVLKRIVAVHRILKKISPDLVVSVPEGTDPYIALDTYINKSYATVMSQRQDPHLEYPTRLKRWLANFYYSRADKVVFQTHGQQSFFKKAVQEKGTIILNPIKEGLPGPARGQAHKEIVTFCRLEKEKNLDLLIGSFAEIHKRYPDFRLRIWGKGKEEKHLKGLVDALKLNGAVALEGYAKNIHEEIKNAFLYVNTSNHEGISNAMLESMAMGIPVVCTDCPCGGARAVIRNKENGILVPVNDKKSLVDTVTELIENETLRTSISRNASKIKNELDCNRIFGQWENVFTEAAKQRK